MKSVSGLKLINSYHQSEAPLFRGDSIILSSIFRKNPRIQDIGFRNTYIKISPTNRENYLIAQNVYFHV